MDRVVRADGAEGAATRGCLVFGATSAIAQALARRLVARGDRLYLVARNGERLESVARDLVARGGSVCGTAVMDALDYGAHEGLLERAAGALSGIDLAIVAHGSLPDQAACEQSSEQTLREVQTNGLSAIALLTHLGNYFESRKSGHIVVLSSVAGDRGRQSNYVYGAAKSALSTFLEGLRNRLHGSGVRVLTVKPGFVDTPMTSAMRKGMLWSQPDRVAGDVLRAISKGRAICYTPWYWRYIMLVVKAIPESLFARLRL